MFSKQIQFSPPTNSDFDGELALAGPSYIATAGKLVSAGSWDSDMIPQKQFAPIGEDEYS